eukprot:1190536-Prorocentrum_minimum.AAC.5
MQSKVTKSFDPLWKEGWFGPTLNGRLAMLGWVYAIGGEIGTPGPATCQAYNTRSMLLRIPDVTAVGDPCTESERVQPSCTVYTYYLSWMLRLTGVFTHRTNMSPAPSYPRPHSLLPKREPANVLRNDIVTCIPTATRTLAVLHDPSARPRRHLLSVHTSYLAPLMARIPHGSEDSVLIKGL